MRTKLVHERMSYRQVSEQLKAAYRDVKGLSIRSIRRFCKQNNIHRTSRLTQEQLDMVVSSGVGKVNFTMVL